MADIIQIPTIQPINPNTIECDPVGFANWLNDLREVVNQQSRLIMNFSERLTKVEYDISCIFAEIAAIKLRLDTLEQCCEDVQQTLIDIQADINTLNNRVTNLEADMSWFIARLPATQAAVPAGFKFGMGNINVMSANGGTPSLNIGIFTSLVIEDNDIYFW